MKKAKMKLYLANRTIEETIEVFITRSDWIEYVKVGEQTLNIYPRERIYKIELTPLENSKQQYI